MFDISEKVEKTIISYRNVFLLEPYLLIINAVTKQDIILLFLNEENIQVT